MSDVGNQISLFCDQIKSRRFDDATIQLLQSILLTGDIPSLLETRTSLKEFLRSESVVVIREVAEQAPEHKLLIIDFLVRAFAIADDVESCLALRYEALTLRDSKYVRHQLLRVSHTEWMGFAEHAFDNGFYSIAAKTCGNALACLQLNSILTGNDCMESTSNVWGAEGIKMLKDVAITLSVTHPVQVQSAEYLKCKTVRSLKKTSMCKQGLGSASCSFRNGIKKRNEVNLQRFRELHTDGN